MPKEFLLISDLDDTLLADDAALRGFRQFFDANGKELDLIYASGRFFKSIKKDIESTELPEPNLVIGGVGSEICNYSDGKKVDDWINQMPDGWSSEKVRELVLKDNRIKLQGKENQAEFKASFRFRSAEKKDIERLKERLQHEGIPVNIIYSSNRDLDVLPKGVDKGMAAKFIADRLGYSSDRIITAGNSGNDSALMQHGFHGIVVANAHSELRALTDEPRIYGSSLPYADGVVDGLNYWISRLKKPKKGILCERPREGIHQEGWDRAIELLLQCQTRHGFVATPNKHQNYNRIWGRDSGVIGLAALLSDNRELINGCRNSLETLARFQGPHGEIPSNVDPGSGRVSYGGTAGRVDADLWFVILNGEYWKNTQDDAFLDKMQKPLEKVRFLLGAWEFNNRGLLFIPPTGDWADEYVQSGYVLYDQLLYLQALTVFCQIHRHRHGSDDHELEDRSSRLRHLIRANYWFSEKDDIPEDVYHEVLYEKGKKAASHRKGDFWMPFFSPQGYGFRFDSLANALAMLFRVADDSQCEMVDSYIADQVVPDKFSLLPAFHPVITPKDEKWQELQMSFSHTFKNEPYEYHNGGLWPMVTGFYAASLAQRGKEELALKYAEGIHRANKLKWNGKKWSFPEFLHGKKATPGGTQNMAWSAAAGILVECYLEGKRLFGGKT